jgi:hypothetical protein
VVYFDSLNILFEKLQIGLLANPLARFASRWEDDVALFLIGFGRLFGVIRFGMKPNKSTLSRAKVLWEEAEKRGLEMREVRILDRSCRHLYRAETRYPEPNKKKIILLLRTSPPKKCKSSGSRNAWMTNEYLRKPVSKTVSQYLMGGFARTYRRSSKRIFDRIQKPVIVKPRLGSRGRHVVTYVSNHDDLRHAFKIARQLCLWVIVEEQIIGPVYR